MVNRYNAEIAPECSLELSFKDVKRIFIADYLINYLTLHGFISELRQIRMLSGVIRPSDPERISKILADNTMNRLAIRDRVIKLTEAKLSPDNEMILILE